MAVIEIGNTVYNSHDEWSRDTRHFILEEIGYLQVNTWMQNHCADSMALRQEILRLRYWLKYITEIDHSVVPNGYHETIAQRALDGALMGEIECQHG